jgi:hypothetical protein
MDNSLLFDMIYVPDFVRMQMIQIKDIHFVCNFNEIINDYFFEENHAVWKSNSSEKRLNQVFRRCKYKFTRKYNLKTK